MSFSVIPRGISFLMLILAGFLFIFPQYIFEIAHFYPLQPLQITELEAYQPKLEGATTFLEERDTLKIPDGVTVDDFLRNLSPDEQRQVHIVTNSDGKTELRLTPPDHR